MTPKRKVHQHARGNKSKKRALTIANTTDYSSTNSCSSTPSPLSSPIPLEPINSGSVSPIHDIPQSLEYSLMSLANEISAPSIVEEKNSSEKTKLDDDINCTFHDWLIRKRQSLKRKRNLLIESEYKTLVFVITNFKNINFTKHKELEWARTLIHENNYTVMKLENLQKGVLEDYVVKLKVGPLLINEIPYYIVTNLSLIENIIAEEHGASAHHGINITHQRIETKYLMVTRDMVAAYIKRCRTCVNHKSVKEVKAKSLNPIVSKGMMHHVVIDLIDYSHDPANEYKYIVHAVDHFTSFHYVDALRNKTGKEVLHFLRRVCSIGGIPCILHSDNGSEFRNSLVEAFIDNNSIEFRHGKPYKPSTQGKVERGNRILKVAIRKLQAQSNYTKSWYDVLFEATMAINNNFSTTHKRSPYEMVYGQKPPQISYDFNVDEVAFSDFDDKDDLIDLSLDENNVSINNNQETKAIDDDRVVLEAPQTTLEHLSETLPLVASVSSVSGDVSSLSEPISKSVAVNLTLSAQEIRDVGMEKYQESIAKTKVAYDRRNKSNKCSIGDVVTVVVPQEIQLNKYSKRFPALVIGYEVIDDVNYYCIGIKDRVVKGKFLSSDLTRESGALFAHFLGIKDINEVQTLTANWGKSRFGKFKYVSLQEAYTEYIKYVAGNALKSKEVAISNSSSTNPHLSQPESDITTSNPIHHNVISHPIPIKPLSSGATCHLCLEKINNLSAYNICFRCKSAYHYADDCFCGAVQVINADGVHFCSRNCFRETATYEKEIVAANARYYTVLWSNGETSKVLKKSLDKYLEYYALVKSWQNKSTSSSSSSTTSIIPSESNSTASNCCKVCNGKLSESNWHRCHGCKAPMHGAIICEKRESIISDDDLLFCSLNCKENH
jgi:hypothetical protein